MISDLHYDYKANAESAMALLKGNVMDGISVLESNHRAEHLQEMDSTFNKRCQRKLLISEMILDSQDIPIFHIQMRYDLVI